MPGRIFTKAPKSFNIYYFAAIDFANLRFFNETANPVDGALDFFGVSTRNSDEARVVNVNFSASFRGDFINHFPTLTNNGANLILA